jgi:hypothetical protein
MSGFDWYLVLICIFEGAILLLLPHYSPRRYFFAVTVRPSFEAPMKRGDRCAGITPGSSWG